LVAQAGKVGPSRGTTDGGPISPFKYTVHRPNYAMDAAASIFFVPVC